MRALADAKKSWPHLCSFQSFTELKIHVSSHKDPQITAGLRSVCWKIFLLFKSLDRSTWLRRLAASRNEYDSLRSSYLRAIEHPDEFESSVDPLSENQESPWVALRDDENLRAEIFQDIERCMPDNMYFRQPATQNMMLDILFIFCKLHPNIGYRQGMHEILAPILWVVERDAIEPEIGEPSPPKEHGEDDIPTALMDPKFIEHDSFTLYSMVMQTAKSFYAPGNQDSVTSKESPMLTRSSHIFEKLLPSVDPKLSSHLVKLEIVPQIFLLRWIRLLFGREFPLNEVLDMWDALFAIDPSLELVNTICIAMILRIRWKLLDSDTNEAFTLLLKYPEHDAPAYTFVKDALYLKDHPTPEGGVEIISRYSQKVPVIEPAPLSPSLYARPASTSSSRSALSPSVGLEALIQGAAKGVIERGEKWGIGKAIRDAVGEVKKNVEVLQAGPSAPRAGGREFRKPARITTSAKSTGPQALLSVRAANVLETRNKTLAKMLQGTVADLWEYHKEQSEHSEVNKASLEALTAAIAKVQFVQVYLDDSSIPLPTDEGASSPSLTAPLSPPERTSSAPAVPLASSSRPSSSLGSPAAFPSKGANDGLPVNPTSRPLSPTQSSQTSHLSPRGRPLLAQSSLSWMLGDHDSSSTFATASAHRGFPSEERRRTKGSLSGKGFLFGEDDQPGGSWSEGKGKAKNVKDDHEVEEEIISLGPVGKGAVA